MSDPRACDKVLLVQAELDGELDAAEAASLAAHRETCPVCRTAAAEIAAARGLFSEELYRPMPEALRRRIASQIAAARPRRTTAPWRLGAWLFGWWRPAAGFGLGAACTAALLMLLVVPRGPDLTGQVIAGHIRALQPGHLEDVPSTDQHTVKPWFDGRIDFAPPVKNFAAAGFPLKGGRLDYLDGRPVAALVYGRDKHLIDLFIWPSKAGAAPPKLTERQGYNVVHWTGGGMTFWAVSDLEAKQLLEFAEIWRRSP